MFRPGGQTVYPLKQSMKVGYPRIDSLPAASCFGDGQSELMSQADIPALWTKLCPEWGQRETAPHHPWDEKSSPTFVTLKYLTFLVGIEFVFWTILSSLDN